MEKVSVWLYNHGRFGTHYPIDQKLNFTERVLAHNQTESLDTETAAREENESVNPSKFKIPKLKLVCLGLYDRTRENHLSHQSISASDLKFSILDREGDAPGSNVRVEKNHNQLQETCSGNLGVMYADLTKVRQIVFNLLSNALKFTEGGTVLLGATRFPSRWQRLGLFAGI